MKCQGRICNRAVFSQAVTMVGTTLVINIPARSFNNNERICLFVIQNIPTTVTIGTPVAITIGTSTVQYPLTKSNCAQVTACGLRTRHRYPIRISTTATSAVFRVLEGLSCAPQNVLASIPVAATTSTPREDSTDAS